MKFYTKPGNLLWNNVRFLTHFSSHHLEIKNNFEKFWPLLTGDPIIKKYLSDRPLVTFKRCQSLRDKLTPTQSLRCSNFCKPNQIPGTFACGSWNYCPWIGDVEDFILPNGKNIFPHKKKTCRNMGIIYLMRCDCQAFYVGKTRQHFQKRVHDHIYAISNGKIDMPIAYHVGLRHNLWPWSSSLRKRGGDWDQLLLRHEARWIHCLKAMYTLWLNDKFKPFLEI